MRIPARARGACRSRIGRPPGLALPMQLMKPNQRQQAKPDPDDDSSGQPVIDDFDVRAAR